MAAFLAVLIAHDPELRVTYLGRRDGHDNSKAVDRIQAIISDMLDGVPDEVPGS